ncbi:antirestriction protein [Aquimarina algiphila]|uniref:Antirestriction protein n=1 Tax=Aquimarina algiphila TaxID=2047982 RepID=A0A554VIK3_9FLAO|nr:antirestriction protein [Aquimarina algiphila]TSE07644.1 antirestriction protein [Aquimarina algiphila]
MKTERITFENYQQSIQKIDINSLPEILQKGHEFFIEAESYYNKEQDIRETIDIYLEQLNNHQSANTELGQLFSSAGIDLVDGFLKMHNTVQSKDELREYIFELQRAVSKKLITKEDPNAPHVEKIQDKLIHQHNEMLMQNEVRIFINRKWRKELQRIISNTNVGQELYGSYDPLPEGDFLGNPESEELFTPINANIKESTIPTFRLLGAFGGFLGDLEKFELAMTVEGDQGGGKTRFTYQLADAFADLGNRIAFFSLEIGKRSDLITRMKEEYLKPQNQSSIFITDQIPEGYDTISKAANSFDVIVIDSWNKTGLPSQDFDRLRKQHPNTIFIIIFQRTTQKTIRGGTAPLYDAGINIEVVKVDDTFQNNYATTTKNRYGVTGIKYNIFTKQITGAAVIQEPLI